MPRRTRAAVRIRRATLRDLDVLVHLRRGMWETMNIPGDLDAGDAVYRRWARQRLRTERLVGFLAVTRDGRVVSGACVWLQEAQPRPHVPGRFQPYLMSMFTEAGFRRQGIGTRIVREAIRWTRHQGYERLVLHASEEGRSVYARLGFEPSPMMRVRLAPPKRSRRR